LSSGKTKNFHLDKNRYGKKKGKYSTSPLIPAFSQPISHDRWIRDITIIHQPFVGLGEGAPRADEGRKGCQEPHKSPDFIGRRHFVALKLSSCKESSITAIAFSSL
jgi:hypothetical protein